MLAPGQVPEAGFEILEVPGHTLDHIAYVHRGEQPVVFCGDTLFAGGCGRLFEGTPDMMLRSLEALAALPEDTRVFCAHEYTLANLAFAQNRARDYANRSRREEKFQIGDQVLLSTRNRAA